jgi:Protein of unknown function (DUF1638)
MGQSPAILIIACGALAREIVALRSMNQWPHMAVQCLPADLHNRPEKIGPAVQEKIRANKGKFAAIFVAYGDCGTGGALDAVLAQENVERLPGAHCYEFFAGSMPFAAMAEEEIGTFYLTDFLLRHFDRLILRGLGIEKHPELLTVYFKNYKKLMYLAQTEDARQIELGRIAAEKLGLTYAHRQTGYGELAISLKQVAKKIPTGVIAWQN